MRRTACYWPARPAAMASSPAGCRPAALRSNPRSELAREALRTSRAASHSGGSRDYSCFSNCMRSHGRRTFRPVNASSATLVGPGSGIDPRRPRSSPPATACGAPGLWMEARRAQLSESDKLRALKFARCMRAHGVPNYPGPNFQAGASQAPAPPDVNSPAGKRAFKACGGARNAPLNSLESGDA